MTKSGTRFHQAAGSWQGDSLLSRETVKRLLDKSCYRDAAEIWKETGTRAGFDATRRHLLQRSGRSHQADALRGRPQTGTLPHRQRLPQMRTGSPAHAAELRNRKSQVLSMLHFPTTRSATKPHACLTPRALTIRQRPFSWARVRARAIIARRADLVPHNPDPELGLADLSSLEKLVAILMLQLYRHEFRVHGSGYASFYAFYHLYKRELQNIMLLLNGIRFRSVLKSSNPD